MKIPTSYIIATSLSAFPAMGAIFTLPAIAVPLLCLLLAPFFISHPTWQKNAYYASVSVFFLIAAFMYFTFVNTLLSVESLSDFEGPHGEGSPIAPVIGMFMGTIGFVIPWTIAAIRGFRLWRRRDLETPESSSTLALPRESDEAAHTTDR